MPVFVNEYEISDAAVHGEMQHHPAPTMDEARLAAARALVVKRLLLEDAARRELTRDISSLTDEEAEAVIARLLDNIITTPEADEGICARYYETHLDRFRDEKTDKTLPYALVKPHIVQYLEDRAYHAAFHAYLDGLMASAEIVGLAA